MAYSIISLVFILSIFSIAFGSVCTGNPPMYNGLYCATTTRYWDGQMGACGCGTGNSDPFPWQWNYHTAAASQAIYDEGGSSWCGAGCGSCFELTPTGDCPYGGDCAVYNSPITIMVTNRCPYIGNEVWCPNPGNVNQWGYGAHFDLMDYMMTGWVDALQWNDPVVTYRQVPCGNQGSPSCNQASQCQCSTAGQCSNGTAVESSSSSSSSSSSTTSTPTTTSTSTTSVPSSNPVPVPTTTSSSSSSSSSSTTSTSTSTSGSSSHSCSATISQSVGQTWNGGGLMNLVIKNTGASSITRVNVNLNVNNSSRWNLEYISEGVWTLPWWAFPLAQNQQYVSSGYTYENTVPEISLSHVAC